MKIDLPEDLSWEQVHRVVKNIKDVNPALFCSLVDIKSLTHNQKMKILDNMLMDHPDLYAGHFTQSIDR